MTEVPLDLDDLEADLMAAYQPRRRWWTTVLRRRRQHTHGKDTQHVSGSDPRRNHREGDAVQAGAGA